VFIANQPPFLLHRGRRSRRPDRRINPPVLDKFDSDAPMTCPGLAPTVKKI
jgi:hypothetical protein